MKNNIFSILCFFSFMVNAQVENGGVILDSQSKTPLNYAALSWRNGQGTITNEEGKYQLFINSEDSVLITVSFIGYQELILNSNELKDTLYLTPKYFELDEVTVIDTDDLKNKVLSHFEKNYNTNLNCQDFFYKQFLKENDKYVNYLEAIGLVNWSSSNQNPEVFIKSVRKTEDLVSSFVNVKSGEIIGLLQSTTKDLLKEGQIIRYDWITSELIEAVVEDKLTKEVVTITINTSDYSIQRVVKNNLSDKLDNKYSNQTIRVNNKKIEFDGYLQGSLLEYDFKKIGDKYYLNRVFQRGKGILLSTDGRMKYQFISEQHYLSIKIRNSCDVKNQILKLEKGKSLKSIKRKIKEENWSRLNGILPLKEQQHILNTLGKLE